MNHSQDETQDTYQLSQQEHERLETLQSYNILDTVPEKEFDDLTKLASNICDTPISLINLIDLNRQWTKSSQGWDLKEIPREDSFCDHTIRHNEWMIVEDATQDNRFKDSLYVQNDPNIRFYAGVNLKTEDGYNLGSLCVIDTKPRKLEEEQLENLKIIANEVVARLELRRQQQQLKQKNKLLSHQNVFLQNSNDIMLLLDPDGLEIYQTFLNTAKTLGYQEQKLTSTSLHALIPSDRAESIMTRIKRWQSHEERAASPLQFELPLVLRDGSKVWFEVDFIQKNNYIYFTGRDIDDERKYERQLTQMNKFSESILDALPGVFYVVDEGNNIVLWNEQTKEVTGYSDTQLNQMDIEQLLHQEDLEVVFQNIEHVRKGDLATLEVRLQTKDGQSIPYYLSSTELRIDKASYIVGTGIDISEKNHYEKELEESLKEQEILLQEIHHRVKNNLAVISGLLELEAFNSDNEIVKNILSDSQLRIKSMAIIHDKLYKSSTFTSVPVKTYFHDLVDAITDIYDAENEISYKIESDAIKLNVNQAIPLALIVNELVTNSYKHAFTGDQKEKWVRLDLSQQKNSIVFEIKDNGEGLPENMDPTSPESLGFTLVNTLIQQLDADLELIDRDQSHLRISFDSKQLRGSSSYMH